MGAGAGETQQLCTMLARALADAGDGSVLSAAQALLRDASAALPAVLLDLHAIRPVRLPEGAELDALVDASTPPVLLALLGFHVDGRAADAAASGSSGGHAMLSPISAAHVVLKLLHGAPELMARSGALVEAVSGMLRSLAAGGSELTLKCALNILEAAADAAFDVGHDATGSEAGNTADSPPTPSVDGLGER